MCPNDGLLVGPLEDGAYEWLVRAVDAAGIPDATPASRSFSITSSGPPIAIVARPPPRSTSRAAVFGLQTPVAGATFQCQWYRGTTPPATWSPCSSQPVGVPLADGPWYFRARAVTATGLVSSPPAVATFVVDNTGPTSVIEVGPRPYVNVGTASFRFRFDEPATAATCAVDGAAPVDCSGRSFQVSGLGAGEHVLRVTGTNDLGNTATTAHRWTVDVTRPVATITVPGPLSGPDLQPSFTSSEPGVFRCNVDATPIFDCIQPWLVLYGLAPGTHILRVWAVDRAGNMSAVAARMWRVA